MAFIPTEKCAKVAIHYTWEAQECISTLWFSLVTEPTQGQLESLADHIGQNFVDMLKPSQASNCAMTKVTATRQASANDIQGVYIPAAPVAGTGVGDSLPLNGTWAITSRTALRGRSFRGRTFLVGLLTSILDDAGTGDGVTLAGIAAGFIQHLITVPEPGWVWVVVSHFAEGVARAAGLATPIEQVSVDTLLDSQRRRLIGRGK